MNIQEADIRGRYSHTFEVPRRRPIAVTQTQLFTHIHFIHKYPTEQQVLAVAKLLGISIEDKAKEREERP